MLVHIDRGEDSIGIALLVICFHCRANLRLGQDEVGKIRRMQVFGIGLENLHDQTFECMKIDVRVWVEKVEVDVDKILLRAVSSYNQHKRNSLTTSPLSSLSLSGSACLRLDMVVVVSSELVGARKLRYRSQKPELCSADGRL